MRFGALLLALAMPMHAAEVDVSAASSLQDALRAIAAHYPDKLVFNFGASSTLAMQIRAGAPVDVFFSADEAKMDSIAVAERVTLLTNTLVIASNERIASPRDLLRLKRVAIAQPDSVPAGIYARKWLQRVGLWTA